MTPVHVWSQASCHGIFWDVTQYRLILIYWHFGTNYHSRHAWLLKMQPIVCPETSVNKYHSSPCSIPVEWRSRIRPTLSHGVSQRSDVGHVVLPKSPPYLSCLLLWASYIYIYMCVCVCVCVCVCCVYVYHFNNNYMWSERCKWHEEVKEEYIPWAHILILKLLNFTLCNDLRNNGE